MCDNEGENCAQLTETGGAYFPRWSPDSEKLAFWAETKGNADVYVVTVGGGFLRRLTHHEQPEFQPSWSEDGKWVYFTSTRSGDNQVWKVPAEGGEAIQVTENGGDNPRESADGRFLYYVKGVPAEGSIWRMHS